MQDQETYRATKKLLRDLKLFMIHVLVYLPANIVLIILAIDNKYFFFPVVLWSIALVYHGFMFYYAPRKQGMKLLFMQLFFS